MVVSAGYQPGATQFVSRERSVFDSRFTKFVLRSSGDIKFVILFEDSDTGGLSSITVRMVSITVRML